MSFRKHPFIYGKPVSFAWAEVRSFRFLDQTKQSRSHRVASQETAISRTGRGFRLRDPSQDLTSFNLVVLLRIQVWEALEPLARSVIGGEAMYKDDDLLFLQRDQFDESIKEETYFSWSFIPVEIEDGSHGGLLNQCFETSTSCFAFRRASTSQINFFVYLPLASQLPKYSPNDASTS